MKVVIGDTVKDVCRGCFLVSLLLVCALVCLMQFCQAIERWLTPYAEQRQAQYDQYIEIRPGEFLGRPPHTSRTATSEKQQQVKSPEHDDQDKTPET